MVVLIVSLGFAPGGVCGVEGDSPDPYRPDQPDVASLSATMPTCMQPDPAENVCYLNWNNFFAQAVSGHYMRSITLTIDDRVRAFYLGFFETYLYVDDLQHTPGLKVPCGGFGTGGNPSVGAVHTFSIRAEDTGGYVSTLYGSVACPGVRLVFLPLVLRASP